MTTFSCVRFKSECEAKIPKGGSKAIQQSKVEDACFKIEKRFSQSDTILELYIYLRLCFGACRPLPLKKWLCQNAS
jgi:hypothetical protein